MEQARSSHRSPYKEKIPLGFMGQIRGNLNIPGNNFIV